MTETKRRKMDGATREVRSLAALLFAASGATLLGGAALADPEAILFDDARIIIELNATDEDVGMQLFLDGEGWRRVRAFDPEGHRILDVAGKGGVGRTGITELFFESEEPSLDEVSLEEFLERFPEGDYRIRGRTVEGELMVGTATLTHAIPEGPLLLTPAPGSMADPTDTVVSWDAVPDPPGSWIVEYQVIVEREDLLRVLDVHVPAAVTSLSVPPEFLEPGKPYKYEVLAIEASGNQTLSESFFETIP